MKMSPVFGLERKGREEEPFQVFEGLLAILIPCEVVHLPKYFEEGEAALSRFRNEVVEHCNSASELLDLLFTS